MQTSPRGLVALVRHEGIVPAPYLDTARVWTFGIGHAETSGLPPNPRLMPRGMPVDWRATLPEVFRLFRLRLAPYERGVRQAVKVTISQPEFDALVSLCFNIGPEALGAVVDRLLGDLPERGAALPDRAEPALTGGISVVPFPGPQATMIFGHAGIHRAAPDFFAAFVLSEILGGGRFSARLMTEVRDRRGLTYGIGAQLSGRQLADLVTGSVQTANATAAETIAVIRAEWARLAQEGITAAELEATRTYLTGAFPLRFDGNARIAQILAAFKMQGLPPGYVAARNALVEAVTLEDANRVARRLFDPDALHFVVVGMPEDITEGPFLAPAGSGGPGEGDG